MSEGMTADRPAVVIAGPVNGPGGYVAFGMRPDQFGADHLADLQRWTEATTVDVFTCGPVDIWLDDEGALKPDRRINLLASVLRGYPVYGIAVLAASTSQGESVELPVHVLDYVANVLTESEQFIRSAAQLVVEYPEAFNRDQSIAAGNGDDWSISELLDH